MCNGQTSTFELSNIITRHEVQVLPRSSRENKAAQHASKNLPMSQCWGLALSQVCNAFSQAVKLIFAIVFLNNTVYTGTGKRCTISLISMTHYYSYTKPSLM